MPEKITAKEWNRLVVKLTRHASQWNADHPDEPRLQHAHAAHIIEMMYGKPEGFNSKWLTWVPDEH